MLTAEQVERALDGDPKFYWGMLDYRPEAIDNLIIDGIEYEFKVLDSKFGEEGDWRADTFIVIRVGNQYFRKTGYYASHDGEYWDGPLTEVVGYRENIIVWRDK